MLALIGFVVGILTAWICVKILRWKEEEVKEIKEDREIE